MFYRCIFLNFKKKRVRYQKSDEACEYFKDEPNEEVEEILNNIQYKIMKKAVRKEFKE